VKVVYLLKFLLLDHLQLSLNNGDHVQIPIKLADQDSFFVEHTKGKHTWLRFNFSNCLQRLRRYHQYLRKTSKKHQILQNNTAKYLLRLELHQPSPRILLININYLIETAHNQKLVLHCIYVINSHAVCLSCFLLFLKLLFGAGWIVFYLFYLLVF
jgi:hypothetical protein